VSGAGSGGGQGGQDFMDLLGQVQPAGAPFLEGFAQGGNLGAEGADAPVEAGTEAGPVVGEVPP